MRALALAILLACLLPQPAAAFEFDVPFTQELEASFEITHTLLLDYHDDNLDGLEGNDGYFDLRNRLNLRLAIDAFTVSARLDTATFFSEPAFSPEDDSRPGGWTPYLGRYGIEKVAGAWQGRHVQVSLGDFYASFGRGLALRIQKVDQISEDTSLLGAKVAARLGPVELIGLSGLTNPTNADGITEKTVEDTYDLVSGLRAVWRVVPQVALAVHGVHLLMDPLDENENAARQFGQFFMPDRAWLAGASLELPDLWSHGDAYLEFDWLDRRFKTDLDRSDGWAVYAGGNIFLGDLTLTAEAKAYRAYELFGLSDDADDHLALRLDYIRPPTLEPEEMEIENNHDITGARLQLDWRPGGGDWLVFASYAGFVALESRPTLSDGRRWIYNTNLGLELDFWRRGRARVRAGLRESVPLYSGPVSTQLIYLDASLELPLAAQHAVSLKATHWFVHEHHPTARLSPNADTIRGDLVLDWSFSPWLSVGLILGWNTTPSGARKLDVFHTTLDTRTDLQIVERQLYMAGSVSANLYDWVTLRVLGGQLRGGPLCVNGVCRILPPFAGLRFEAVVRL